MRIKNHKDVYRRVAENKNIDPKIVEALGTFIYEDLERRVANFEHRDIYVLRLGTFIFRQKKAKDVFGYLENMREALAAKYPDKKEEILREYDIRTKRIQDLIDEWDEINRERNEFKLKRDGQRPTTRYFQEPIKDMGGPEEQGLQEGSCRGDIQPEDPNM